jgi:hypothetical protein
LSPLKEIAEETPATVPSHPTRFTKKIRRNPEISPKTKIAAEQQKPQQQRILKPFLPIRNKKKKAKTRQPAITRRYILTTENSNAKKGYTTRQDQTD